MIRFTSKGDWSKTKEFLKRDREQTIRMIAERYAKQGVNALSSATPYDSGLTSESWSYEIVSNKSQTNIYFNNSNFNDGVPIAVILQYGHGTRNGGYVEGIDYINPALAPIFNEIAENAWKEVIRD